MQCWGLIHDRRRLNCDFVIFFTGLHTYHYTMHVLVFITNFNKPTLSRTYCMAILDTMNNMVLFLVTSHVPEPHTYMAWSWSSLCLQMPQDLMVLSHQQPHRHHKVIHDFFRKYINHIMMMSWNGNIIRVTGPLCGEFTGPGEFPAQRPVTRSFDVFFDLRLNKRLGKQPWGWWFETPSWSFWR